MVSGLTRVGVLQLGTRPVAVRPAAPVDQLEVAFAGRRRTRGRIGAPHLQMMPVTLLSVILLLLQKLLLPKPSPLESPKLALPLLSLALPPLLLLLPAPPPLPPPLNLLFALGLLLSPLFALVLPVLFRAPLIVQLLHEVPVILPIEAVAVDELSAADAVRAVVPVPSPRVAPRRMPAAVAQVAVYAVAVLVASGPVGNGTDEVPRQFVRRL